MKLSAYTLLLFIIIFSSTTPLISDNNDDVETMYVYTPTGIYLRENCGQKSKKIMLLPHMAKVHFKSFCEVFKSEIINGVAGYWVSVTTADEKEGYVFSGYLSNKKKKLEKNDIISEKKMNEIKKDIHSFVTDSTKKNESKFFELDRIYITIDRFTESSYQREVYEYGSAWLNDFKKEKKEFDLLKTGVAKKNCRIVEIKERNFALYIYNEECCGGNNYIRYETFINNVKITFFYADTLSVPPCYQDLFVKDNNSIHNILYTMKGKEYISFFEELVSEVAETVAKAK